MTNRVHLISKTSRADSPTLCCQRTERDLAADGDSSFTTSLDQSDCKGKTDTDRIVAAIEKLTKAVERPENDPNPPARRFAHLERQFQELATRAAKAGDKSGHDAYALAAWQTGQWAGTREFSDPMPECDCMERFAPKPKRIGDVEITGSARGGIIAGGSPGDDSVPIRDGRGYVWTAKEVAKMGRPVTDQIRGYQSHAPGGYIPGPAEGVPARIDLAKEQILDPWLLPYSPNSLAEMLDDPTKIGTKAVAALRNALIGRGWQFKPSTVRTSPGGVGYLPSEATKDTTPNDGAQQRAWLRQNPEPDARKSGGQITEMRDPYRGVPKGRVCRHGKRVLSGDLCAECDDDSRDRVAANEHSPEPVAHNDPITDIPESAWDGTPADGERWARWNPQYPTEFVADAGFWTLAVDVPGVHWYGRWPLRENRPGWQSLKTGGVPRVYGNLWVRLGTAVKPSGSAVDEPTGTSAGDGASEPENRSEGDPLGAWIIGGLTAKQTEQFFESDEPS